MAVSADQSSAAKNLNFDDTIDDDDDGNPWEELLSESKISSSKLQEHKNIILLGDIGSGKTTLIAKLQTNEEPEKGSGLEFTHLTIKDEYREDSTKLGVWILDGDSTHAGLLKYAVTKENFADTLVVLTVSMSHPWSIIKSLTEWLAILTDHIDRIGVIKECMATCEHKLVKQWQDYVEPDVNTSSRHSGVQSESEAVVLPLPDGVLTHNLGIPIIVVVTKSDAISNLEKEYDFKDETFDFIQQQVRKLCLSYGAALFYISVREEKNVDLLHKYIAHRLYGLEFTSPALVVDRDAVLIPSGWDSGKKIDILSDNLTTIKADDDFESVVTRPVTVKRPANRDAEASAEEEQEFLNKCQSLLSKGAPPVAAAQGATAPVAAVVNAEATPLTRTPSKTSLPKIGSAPALTPSPKKGPTDGKAATQQGETVLANFFNSLLTKKTGTSSATPSKPSTDTKTAAAAELDRMTRNPKST